MDNYTRQWLMQYGLEGFYDDEANAIIIPDDVADSIFDDIKRFILNNENYALGHDLWGTDEGYWFIEL